MMLPEPWPSGYGQCGNDPRDLLRVPAEQRNGVPQNPSGAGSCCNTRFAGHGSVGIAGVLIEYPGPVGPRFDEKKSMPKGFISIKRDSEKTFERPFA